MLAQSKHRTKLRDISSTENHVSILSSFCLSIDTYVELIAIFSILLASLLFHTPLWGEHYYS